MTANSSLLGIEMMLGDLLYLARLLLTQMWLKKPPKSRPGRSKFGRKLLNLNRLTREELYLELFQNHLDFGLPIESYERRN